MNNRHLQCSDWKSYRYPVDDTIFTETDVVNGDW